MARNLPERRAATGSGGLQPPFSHSAGRRILSFVTPAMQNVPAGMVTNGGLCRCRSAVMPLRLAVLVLARGEAHTGRLKASRYFGFFETFRASCAWSQ